KLKLMKPQAIDNQAKAKRYLVVLRDDKKSSLKKMEKELKVQLVPSSELNSNNRAFKVMSKDVGIFYKNLNIAVVDQVPVETLKSAVSDSNSPVLYWEEEREYRTANEMELLNSLKKTASDLQLKLQELEMLLKKPKRDETSIWNNSTWGLVA